MSDDDGTRRPGRPAPRFGEYASPAAPGSSSDGSGLSEADARIVAEAAEYRRAQAERDAPAAPAGRGAKKATKASAPQTLAEQMAEERKAARERMLAERREAEKAAEAERRQARRAPSSTGAVPPAADPASQPGRPGYLPAQDTRRAGSRLDAAVTFGLLTAGGFNLLLTLGSYTQLPATFDRMYQVLGSDASYTSTPLTMPIGIAMIVVNAVVFLATALLAAGRVRRGRIAFWIPLAGALAAGLLSFALLYVLISADPVMQQIMMDRGL